MTGLVSGRGGTGREPQSKPLLPARVAVPPRAGTCVLQRPRLRAGQQVEVSPPANVRTQPARAAGSAWPFSV